VEGIVLVIHILVCVFLVVIVLLQSGKSADLAGAFGGMGSQSTFGPRGTATILSKLTTTLAILFMVTSLTLWIIGARKGSSGTQTVLKQEDVKQEQTTTSGEQKEQTGQTEEQKSGTDTTEAKDTGKAPEQAGTTGEAATQTTQTEKEKKDDTGNQNSN
jgi:preprotein translocase subunit SecG